MQILRAKEARPSGVVGIVSVAAISAFVLVQVRWPGTAHAVTRHAHCNDQAQPLTDPMTNEGESSVRVFQRNRDRLIASWTSSAPTRPGDSTAQGSVVVAQREPDGTWKQEIVSPDPSGSSWIDTAPSGLAYVSYTGLRAAQVTTFVRRVAPGQPPGTESALPLQLAHPALAVDQSMRRDDWLTVVGDAGLAGVSYFSYDGGRTWSQPVRFPRQIDPGYPYFPQAGPAIASGGNTTVVAWREEYYDGENRVRTAIRAAPVSPKTREFGRAITVATMPYGSSLRFGAQPFPSVSVVREGKYKGRAYVVWPQAGRALEPGLRPADVYSRYSDDGGGSWSPPVQVNDDPAESAHHVYPSVATQPDGSAFVAWLDSRDSDSQTTSQVTGLMYGSTVATDGRSSPNRRLTYCSSHTEDAAGEGAAYGHYFNFDASVGNSPTLMFPNIRDVEGLSDVFLLEMQ